MSAVVSPVLVAVEDVLSFLGSEAPLVSELFNARQAGTPSDVLVAAIRGATLALSDETMRAELKGG